MALNIEKLKERFEKRPKRNENRLQLKAGDNQLRLLPPSSEYFSKDIDYAFYHHMIHFSVGPNKQAEVCPRTFDAKARCPICEASWTLRNSDRPEDKQLSGELRAKHFYLFNALDLKDLQKGVQVLEVGVKIKDQLMMYLTNPKCSLLDVDRGHNIMIKKVQGSGGARDVEYHVSPEFEPSSVVTLLPEDFKQKLDLLAKQVQPSKSYGDLLVILQGEEAVKDVPLDDDDEEEEVPHHISEVKKPSVVRDAQVAVVANSTVTPSKAIVEKPSCFSTDFGPKKEKCVSCTFRIDCREEYLKL